MAPRYYASNLQINGVIDVSRPVLDNLNEIAGASLAWVIWDPRLGQWSAILNRYIDLSKETWRDYSDHNILGSLNFTGLGVTEMYNSATISFPSADIAGDREYVDLTLEANKRFVNEIDNNLSVSNSLINNPVHATRVAALELLQSRVDRVVQFKTDFTSIGIRAGDFITITNDTYGLFISKFRVIKVEEVDGEDGGIDITLTAVEVSDIYGTSGLIVDERNKITGIVPRSLNTCVKTADNQALAGNLSDALLDPGSSDAMNSAFTSAGFPLFNTEVSTWSTGQVLSVFGPGTGVDNANSFNRDNYQLQNGQYTDAIREHMPALITQWNTNSTLKSMTVDVLGPQGQVNISVDGVAKVLYAGIPMYVSLFYSQNDNGPWTFYDSRYMEWSSYVSSFSLGAINVAPLSWIVILSPLVTYDLSSTNLKVDVTSVTEVFPSGNGSGAGVTVQAFLN